MNTLEDIRSGSTVTHLRFVCMGCRTDHDQECGKEKSTNIVHGAQRTVAKRKKLVYGSAGTEVERIKKQNCKLLGSEWVNASQAAEGKGRSRSAPTYQGVVLVTRRCAIIGWLKAGGAASVNI
jgi:hypothetical protein